MEQYMIHQIKINPFGFIEIKHPYSAQDKTSLEAAANSSYVVVILVIVFRRRDNVCIMSRNRDRWQLENGHGVIMTFIPLKA